MAKYLIYFTNENVTSVLWRGGGAVAERAFSLDGEGHGAFVDYLKRARADPVYLLTDLIEEDFRLETLPHAGWRDRRNLLERKLQQLYRATPYRIALPQGRVEQGRRDDRVLFSALTNPELLEPWLRALYEARAPLMGIYSTSLLTEELLKALPIKDEQILLVTKQANLGWRQTYCHRGRVRFSRFTRMDEHDVDDPNHGLAEEIRRTWQYLDSISALVGGDSPTVHLVAHQQELPQLSTTLHQLFELRTVSHDINALAAKLRVRQPPRDSDAVPLYLHLLDVRTPKKQLAPESHTHLAQLWGLRRVAWMAAATLLIGSATVSALNLFEARQLQHNLSATADHVERILAKRDQTLSSFPATVMPAETMSEVVTFHDRVIAPAPDFIGFAQRLSRVLPAFPNVRLEQIVWGASGEGGVALGYQLPATSGGRVPTNSTAPLTPAGGELAAASGYAQAAVIEAAIDPFQGDYRGALDEIDRLGKALQQAYSARVTALLLPLDASADNRLRGSATPEQTKADTRFALQLVFAETRR